VRQESLCEGWETRTLSRSQITTLAGVEPCPDTASWNQHYGPLSTVDVGLCCGVNGVIGSLRGINIGRVRTVEAEPYITRTKQELPQRS